MPVFRLAVKGGAPAALVATSPHCGPILVEASDETTARVIAKTNFWTIQTNTDGLPRFECLWMDRDWVECVVIPQNKLPKAPQEPADRDEITCPDFFFDNGRFARLLEWPAADRA